MFYEKLTELDKKRIVNYIDRFAERDTCNKMAPLDYILKNWESAKSTGILSEIFKDDLIITKPIEFCEGAQELMDKMEKAIWNDERTSQFIIAMRAQFRHKMPWRPDFTEEESKEYNREYNEESYIYSLTSSYTLADNKVDHDLSFLLGDKVYKVQAGSKPLRAITKLANYFNIGITPDENGITDLEYFRRAHSMALNCKKLSGDLCLSIHPMDYMTMSDNDCGWGSCMSWMEGGEYRQGTVEMMNSPCIVVAYLSSNNFDFLWNGGEEGSWNSKKWRSLFIIDKNFVINVKGYPYHNEHLVKAAIAEITKLAGWGEVPIYPYTYYEDYDTYRRTRTPWEVEGYSVAMEFCCDHMYCDFGHNHFIAFNPNSEDKTLPKHYNYSGVDQCMWCGATQCIDGEHNLTCCDCLGVRCCDCCGEDVYSNDRMWTTAEGCSVCEYCWDNETSQDAITEEYYLDSHMVKIYLNEDKEVSNKDALENCLIKHYIEVYEGHLNNEEYFIELPETITWYERIIKPEQLTKKGLQLFEDFGRDY